MNKYSKALRFVNKVKTTMTLRFLDNLRFASCVKSPTQQLELSMTKNGTQVVIQ
jgi:hypothetical protein